MNQNDRHERKVLIDALRILEQQEQALEAGKLDRYVPHTRGIDGGQLAFHKSDAKVRLLITGNRFGKSVCANVIEPAFLATGTHPYHAIPVPNRGKIYADSYPAVMENLFVKFEEWYPKRILDKRKPYEFNNQGMLIGVNFANGSLIKIGSYDQETRKAEGSNWHYVGYDEPPPRALYIANMRGLVDFGGLTWIAATPLSEAWIYDDLWMPGFNKTKDYIHCFRGTPDDNPHIDKTSLGLFLSELTDEEKEIRYHGNFSKLRGLVLDTYDSRYSDVDDFTLNGDYAIYEGIDPHPNKPHTAIWKAVRRDGKRFICGELYCPGSIREFGIEIAAKRKELTKHGAMFLKSVCDTSLNSTDPAYRVNLRDELCKVLREFGESEMPYNAQKKDWLLPGIQKLKDLFRVVVQEDGQLAPMQYVFKSCKKYRYEVTHYQWPEGVQKTDAKPVKKNDEGIDCDRYIESVAPKYETPGSRFLKSSTQGVYRPILHHEERSL